MTDMISKAIQDAYKRAEVIRHILEESGVPEDLATANALFNTALNMYERLGRNDLEILMVLQHAVLQYQKRINPGERR